MSQALYRKWRPGSWEEVVGQEHVITTLRNSVASERIAHAYLFAGPRGTGKTTTARLLAKAANCLHDDPAERPCNECEHCTAVADGSFIDLIEIDAASNTSVDDVRSLREKINFSPNYGRYKVYIIDEVHMLSTAAFNALLKTLEEPPSHAIFVLATTEVHKIPATVLSRCQRHEFRRIPVAEIRAELRRVAEAENISINDDALTLISRQATGALRDAISLLDQLASSGETITLEMAQEMLGTAANQSVLDVVQALLDEDTTAGFDRIHSTLDGGSDPRQFARQIVDYLRALLLIHMDSADRLDATAETRALMARHAQSISTNHLLEVIRSFNQASLEARGGWQPSLPLELAFVEVMEVLHGASPAQQPQAPASRAEPKRAEAKPQYTAPAPNPPHEETVQVPPDPGSGRPEDVLFRRILDNWKTISSKVREQNSRTQALLNSCRPVGMKDGVLFLGFSGEFAKTEMEKPKNRDLTCQVLEEVLGVEVPIRCFISAGRGGKLPPDVESDGMVAAALRDLGGEVVDVQ